MTLIFVIDILGVGGKERRCLELIKGLNDLGVKNIHLVLFDNVIGYQGVYDLDVKIHILGRKSKKDIGILFKLVNLIKSIKPDIVLSWSLMSSFWLNLIHLFNRFNYLSAYVANCNKPKLISLGNVSRLMSFFSSKYIIGNSEIGLRTYKVPRKKSVLIYNGFDFRRLDYLIDIEHLKLSLDIKTRYVVTMVGRMTDAKDFQTFLDSARFILHERSDTTFLAVGDGPLLGTYVSQISDLEKTYIKFVGYKSNVEEIIQASDICVLCSPSEGVSNFIVESMALGKPIVASNTGGTPEVIISGVNGYLVQHKQPVELKTKILNLLNDENLRYSLGSEGKKHVNSKFSLEIMCNRYYELFNLVIFNRRHS